ncbi:unnamed protein product [Ilex paraguariensis]|uniref:DUF4378 domain-containing protein n=1 Tax=Ilex paraguariensis TaxID=185542 RepID=A0ABC8QNY6_9AQUA
MAKRSLRRPLRHEKDQTGCIWGLISILDFRHGRPTRKLLSDRRRGSRHAFGSGYSRAKVDMVTNFEEKCQSIKDGEERKTATADAVKTSVKELVQEEMCNEEGSKKHTNSPEAELKQFDSEHGDHARRSHKQINKNCNKSCDMPICNIDASRFLEPENSSHQIVRRKKSINLDLVKTEELCHQIHQKSTNSVKLDWHDDLDMQSNQAHSCFQEKITTAIKVIIDQRFTNEKHLTNDGKTDHSKEFTDALQMLSSNKELLFKLVEDPKSPLVKCIQELENAQLDEDQTSKSLVGLDMLEEKPTNSRPDELVNRKRRNFFRRRSRSRENISRSGNETCPPSRRIVILKPGPAGLRNSDTEINVSTSLQSGYTMEKRVHSERNASLFSFTEIKRKLKHAMGKEQHGISLDSTIYRFPPIHQNLGDGEKGVGGESTGWSSPNRNHFYTEKFVKPSIGVKKRDKINKSRAFETSMSSETSGYPRQGVSNIYIEAKKHLSEMLINGDENAALISGQLPETLGRILSLPEYNFSPSSSPGKDNEHGFVTAQMRLSPHSNFKMVNKNPLREKPAVYQSSSLQNFESQPRITDDNPDEKLPSPNSIPGLSCEVNRDSSEEETLFSTRDEICSQGVVEILNPTDTGYQENGKTLDVSHEASGSLVIRDVQDCDTAEVSDEDFEEVQVLSSPSVSPSSTSVTRKIEGPESTIDRLERPSPISVLEQLYVDDDISPASTIVRPVESALQPLQIHFEEQLSSATEQGICARTSMEEEESAFEYVEAVLLGSDLNWDEFLWRWLSLDEVLDPSLFDEVELFSNRSCHDQKLLFDCTNEVLKEICEHYFGCFPRISSFKQGIRPVPRSMNLIHEVWEGVEWHLLQKVPHPRSLDRLVGKDLAKSRTWIDLRFETGHTGVEIGKVILEELMEDVILSLVKDSPEEGFPMLLDRLNGSESTVNA